MKVLTLILLLTMASCSLFGIQSEERPQYEVITKDGDFEIRKYSSYIIAKVNVDGSYDKSSGKAFRILAGYIFGKNKGSKKISMTSPVQMNESSKSEKIAMTSPVQMKQQSEGFEMSFMMPSKYSLGQLPEPLDPRIKFEEVPPRVVASVEFTWLASDKRNKNKEGELRKWLKKFPQYKSSNTYSYAGYNPPWTIPFLRRNEVHIQLSADNSK